MNVKPEVNNFYLQNKRKMDKSNFDNILPKIYNYLLNEFKYYPNYKKLKQQSINKFKYEISCTIKPDTYDLLNNKVPDYVLNYISGEQEKINKYKELMDKILIENSNINEYINTSVSLDISGIQTAIQDLDSKIQTKRAIMDDLEISNNGKVTNNNTIDEFVEKNYQNISKDGTIINNDVNYLSKTQKEIEIYQKIIYILYFLLSSSLGFFYLFKNK